MVGAITPTPAPGSTPPFMSVDSNSLRTERSRMSRRCDLETNQVPTHFNIVGYIYMVEKSYCPTFNNYIMLEKKMTLKWDILLNFHLCLKQPYTDSLKMY
jgi:hypothetical protein